jgi:hypothetical protein
MPSLEKLSRIQDAVLSECLDLLGSQAFVVWKTENNSWRIGDIIICNNSFLYRENSTGITKNDYCLGFKAINESELEPEPVILSSRKRINLQFKKLSPKEQNDYHVLRLEEAIQEELQHLGSIVFSLVGKISDPELSEVSFSDKCSHNVLRFSPSLQQPVQFEKDIIVLNDVSDLTRAWEAVNEMASASNIEINIPDKEFADSFNELQQKIELIVDPTDVVEGNATILGHMIERMKNQFQQYCAYLDGGSSLPDGEINPDLLRIAYNLADGICGFLKLTSGICDLKPIIFWLTIYEQIELAHHFAKLPFSLVGENKPSLKSYRNIISTARNKQFHDVFAFEHSFKAVLPDNALSNPKLRIFPEYAKRNDPTLTYDDDGLVQLFKELTRTSEQAVPEGVWEGNRNVIDYVIRVARALNKALLLVAN